LTLNRHSVKTDIEKSGLLITGNGLENNGITDRIIG